MALLRNGDITGARRALAGRRGPESQVAAAGLEQYGRGAEAVSEAMASTKSRLKLELERNLGVLGTLGNNAPFIGLFGTVLGIIKAFADLSRNQAGGAGAVMSGISEALVATAVGLMVAIPAVIGFNFFQGRVRGTLGRVDAMAHLILGAVATPPDSAAAAARPLAAVAPAATEETGGT
jgi:biopolymer transport protein ExbB